MKRLVAYCVGKLAVKLHYRHWLDIYALCSVHDPERYKRTQKKVKIPSGIRWAVWRRDNFTCVYCLQWGNNLSLDHVVPEVKDGQANEKNFVTACTSCNNKKADNTFEEFIRSPWLRNRRAKNLRHLSRTQMMPPTLVCTDSLTGQSSLQRDIDCQHSPLPSKKRRSGRGSGNNSTQKTSTV